MNRTTGRLLAACLLWIVSLVSSYAYDFSVNNWRLFTPVDYATDKNLKGDVLIFGNSMMYDQSKRGCAKARVDNHRINVMYADKDTDDTTFNSTSADLILPSGVQKEDVVWAGLYWQGYLYAGTATEKNSAATVLLKAPRASSYTAITSETAKFNWLYVTGDVNERFYYQGASDVTAIVKNVGAGTYWVANIQSSIGKPNGGGYGAWSIVVVYKDSSSFKNISIYDGYLGIGTVGATADGGVFSDYNITLSGFLAPTIGSVDSSFLIFSGEGDTTKMGDALKLSRGSSLSDLVSIYDALNPSNNAFNSSISNLGSLVTTRNPSCRNTIGMDIDRFNVGSDATASTQGQIIKNSQTQTRVNMTSSGDNYYPGVFAFAVASAELFKAKNDTGSFEAWETGITGTPRVYTKLAGTPFSVRIGTAKGDLFDGKVCVRVNQSGALWKEANFSNASAVVVSGLTAPMASKETAIRIRFDADKEKRCGDMTNENLSTARFAVRPSAFSALFKVGENNMSDRVTARDYNLTLTAVNGGGGYTGVTRIATDLNGSAMGCVVKSGFLHNEPLEPTFVADNNTSDVNLTDVGQVRIFDDSWTAIDQNISDVSGTTWGCVKGSGANTMDIDGRYGCDIETSVRVRPYALNMASISATLPPSAPPLWVYMSDNLATYAAVETTVTARNAEGDKTKNFDAQCVAETVPLGYYMSEATAVDYILTAELKDQEGATLPGSGSSRRGMLFGGQNFALLASSFEQGVAKAILHFNIADRLDAPDANAPMSPMRLQLDEIKSSFGNGVNNQNLSGIAQSFDLLYGRVNPMDASISVVAGMPIEGMAHLFVEIWDPNGLIAGLDNSLTSPGWKINAADTTTLVGNGFQEGDVTVGAITNKDGLITVGVRASASMQATLHLSVEEYLWYRTYGQGYVAPSAPTNADCATHPCLDVEFMQLGNGGWVGNGDKAISTLPQGRRSKRNSW